MYNLPGSDTGLEFIELYNNSDDTINISGFTFSHGITHDFPTNSIVPPRGFILLGDDGSKLTKLFGVQFKSWNAGSLLNSGEFIQILNANGTVIDDVLYSNNSQWPTKANGKGSSLEIINPDNDNNTPLNWRASEYHFADLNNQNIFASPGAIEINLNSVFYFTSESLSLFEGETGTIEIHLKNAEKIGSRVNLIIGEHSATENSDFHLSTKNIQYTGLETIFHVQFMAIKDFIKEDEEYFELKLDSALHAIISPSNSSIKIKIKDTDQGSADICINEVNRHSTSTSPKGNVVPFIELANVDFYSENLDRYTLKAESEDTIVSFELKDYTSVTENDFSTIWIEENALFVGLRSVMFSNGEIQLSLIKDNILVNTVSVPSLLNTEVYARVYDCDDTFEKRAVATPNGSNNNVYVFENTNSNDLKVYPNPARNNISFPELGHYGIYNSVGAMVKALVNSRSADISDLPYGLYFVKAEDGKTARFFKTVS